MKSRISLCVFLCIFCVTPLFAAPLSESESAILKKRLIPTPQQVRFGDGPEVILDKTLKIVLEIGAEDSTAKENALAIFERYFGAKPKISVSITQTAPKEKEAYRIRAAGQKLTISAADFVGIRYAFSTLRQLAESNRGTEKIVDYRIPETEIDDAPAMEFRGVHLCWFPETTPGRIEQALRLAAYYKFNHLVLEFWGTYPHTFQVKVFGFIFSRV